MIDGTNGVGGRDEQISETNKLLIKFRNWVFGPA